MVTAFSLLSILSSMLKLRLFTKAFTLRLHTDEIVASFFNCSPVNSDSLIEEHLLSMLVTFQINIRIGGVPWYRLVGSV